MSILSQTPFCPRVPVLVPLVASRAVARTLRTPPRVPPVLPTGPCSTLSWLRRGTAQGSLQVTDETAPRRHEPGSFPRLRPPSSSHPADTTGRGWPLVLGHLGWLCSLPVPSVPAITLRPLLHDCSPSPWCGVLPTPEAGPRDGTGPSMMLWLSDPQSPLPWALGRGWGSTCVCDCRHWCCLGRRWLPG